MLSVKSVNNSRNLATFKELTKGTLDLDNILDVSIFVNLQGLVIM